MAELLPTHFIEVEGQPRLARPTWLGRPVPSSERPRQSRCRTSTLSASAGGVAGDYRTTQPLPLHAAMPTAQAYPEPLRDATEPQPQSD